MKIIATLIHEGISYGITEGTKVPEKPINEGVYSNVNFPDLDLCKPPYSDRCIEGGHGCNCDYLKRQYLKSLLDASIKWEEGETEKYVMASLPPDAVKLSGNEFEFIDGIYPLEGVEAEPIEQFKHKQIPRWIDKIKPRRDFELYEAFKDSFDIRTVLRLIPQPSSEHNPNKYPKLCVRGGYCTTVCGCDMKEIERINKKVEGTEVSEPTKQISAAIHCIQEGYKLYCNDASVEDNAKELLKQFTITRKN